MNPATDITAQQKTDPVFDEFIMKTENMELGLSNYNLSDDSSDISSLNSDSSSTTDIHRDTFFGSLRKSFSTFASKVFGGKNQGFDEPSPDIYAWRDNKEEAKQRKRRKFKSFLQLKSNYNDAKMRLRASSKSPGSENGDKTAIKFQNEVKSTKEVLHSKAAHEQPCKVTQITPRLEIDTKFTKIQPNVGNTNIKSTPTASNVRKSQPSANAFTFTEKNIKGTPSASNEKVNGFVRKSSPPSANAISFTEKNASATTVRNAENNKAAQSACPTDIFTASRFRKPVQKNNLHEIRSPNDISGVKQSSTATWNGYRTPNNSTGHNRTMPKPNPLPVPHFVPKKMSSFESMALELGKSQSLRSKSRTSMENPAITNLKEYESTGVSGNLANIDLRKRQPLNIDCIKLLPSGKVQYYGHDYSLHFLKSVVPLDQYQAIVATVVQQEKARREQSRKLEKINEVSEDSRAVSTNIPSTTLLRSDSDFIAPLNDVSESTSVKEQMQPKPVKIPDESQNAFLKHCEKIGPHVFDGLPEPTHIELPLNGNKGPQKPPSKTKNSSKNIVEPISEEKRKLIEMVRREFQNISKEEIEANKEQLISALNEMEVTEEDRKLMKNIFHLNEINLLGEELEDMKKKSQTALSEAEQKDTKSESSCSKTTEGGDLKEKEGSSSQSSSDESLNGIPLPVKPESHKSILYNSRVTFSFNERSCSKVSRSNGKSVKITSRRNSIRVTKLKAFVQLRNIACQTLVDPDNDKLSGKATCCEPAEFTSRPLKHVDMCKSLEQEGKDGSTIHIIPVFSGDYSELIYFVTEKAVQTKPVRTHAIFGVINGKQKTNSQQAPRKRSPSPVRRRRNPSPVDLQEYLNKLNTEKQELEEEETLGKKAGRKMGKNGKKVEKKNKKK